MAKPLVPWMGGKSKLAASILPLFPDHRCYVEPFAGAGGIFFTKAPSAVEVLNDLNGDIVNLYRVVKHHLEELYRQFKWVLVSREQWNLLSATPAKTLTDVQRAARFLYLQKLAFGGKATGQTFGTATTTRPKFNLLTLETDLVEAHARLAQVTIEQGPWSAMFQRYDRADTPAVLGNRGLRRRVPPAGIRSPGPGGRILPRGGGDQPERPPGNAGGVRRFHHPQQRLRLHRWRWRPVQRLPGVGHHQPGRRAGPVWVVLME